MSVDNLSAPSMVTPSPTRLRPLQTLQPQVQHLQLPMCMPTRGQHLLHTYCMRPGTQRGGKADLFTSCSLSPQHPGFLESRVPPGTLRPRSQAGPLPALLSQGPQWVCHVPGVGKCQQRGCPRADMGSGSEPLVNLSFIHTLPSH